VAAGIYREVWSLPVADDAVRKQVSSSSTNLLLVLRDSLWHLGLQGPTAAAPSNGSSSSSSSSSNSNNSSSSTSSSDQNAAAVPQFLSRLRFSEPTLAATNSFSFGTAGVYELTQACLMSKAAHRAGVQALVLTGPYLHSQLAVLQAAASTQPGAAACVLAGSQGLHVMLVASTAGAPAVAVAGAVGRDTDQQQQQQQQQQEVLQQRLASLFGPTAVLPDARLAAARAAEQALCEQLRLFSPVTWSLACQRLLMRRPPEGVAVSV
jgi:hypothetical protein